MTLKKTVIIGAGFGGLEVAKRLKKADTSVTLIDRMNHHLFQPLLYQVATGALSPADIAVPVRQILAKQKNTNTSFLMGTVTTIDKEKKTVFLENGTPISFDYLVVAPGASHSYYGRDEWSVFAPGMKTVQDALLLREKIFSAFERAERATTYEEGRRLLRFVIIGAGPTGVELAGAVAEIAFKHMAKNYRHVAPDEAEIFLLEGAPQVLPMFPLELSIKAEKALHDLGVKVRCNSKVTHVTADGVYLGDEFIFSKNVVWAAGNQASALLKNLDVPLDRQGRVIVEPDLSIPGSENIFVIGDAANAKDSNGVPCPGLAPVAKQQGEYVAKIIKKDAPKEKRKPFKYFDKGNLATIGRGEAVGTCGPLSFSGFFAWLIWCVVHIFYLVGSRNRIVVLMQWGFWYFHGKRKVELITQPLDLPPHIPLE